MKLGSRHRARECALQALYSWQLSHNNITDITTSFLEDQDMSDVDIPYFDTLYTGSAMHAQELDKLMAPYLSRQLKELDPIESAILRIALFELRNRREVPYKVAINEAIELAKTFGAEESYKFINGALDKIAPTVRPNKK